MNMTGKMCTEIATFTDFITEILPALGGPPAGALPLDPSRGKAFRRGLALQRSPYELGVPAP